MLLKVTGVTLFTLLQTESVCSSYASNFAIMPTEAGEARNNETCQIESIRCSCACKTLLFSALWSIKAKQCSPLRQPAYMPL